MTQYQPPYDQRMGADLSKLFQRVSILEQQLNAAVGAFSAFECTSSTRPAFPVVGQEIHESDTGSVLLWTGTTWSYIQQGAWTTGFTPAWTQTGQTPSLGNGAVTTGYARGGRTVSGRYQYVFGSATNFGSGINSWNFSVPVPAVSPVSNFWNAGSWSALCNGTFYTGSVRVETTGVLGLFVNNSTQSVHTTNPGTWGTGNYLQMSFQYESTS